MIKNTFEEIMETYKMLPFLERQLVRQAAAKSLREQGAEEIGSSDTNHAIVSLYKQYGDFDEVLDSYYPIKR